MAEEELIVKAPPEAVKKGGYCIIRGNPCRLDVCEVLPKATANGNKRLHLKGPHVFTGKSYEDTLNLTAGFHGIDVPVTVKAQYSLLDADSDTGFLSLLTDSGDCKEDVGLARGEDGAFDQLGKEVIRRFEAARRSDSPSSRSWARTSSSPATPTRRREGTKTTRSVPISPLARYF